MSWTLGGFGRSGYNILGFFENQQYITNADGTTRNISQYADTRSNMLFGRYNLGWDYEINKYNFLTASVSLGVRNMRNNQDGLLTNTSLDDVLQSSILRDVNTDNLSNNVDVNFNYTKSYEKKGKEFSISGLYSQNNLTNDFINSQYDDSFESISRRIKNLNAGTNREFTIQLDYVTPLAENQILEYSSERKIGKRNVKTIHQKETFPYCDF